MTSSTTASTAAPAKVLDGAQLAFSKVESDIITIDGRKFRVTIRIKEDDTWQEVDLSRCPRAFTTEFIGKCAKIYAAMGPANANSFTLHLQSKPGESSLAGATLGRFIDYFKDAAPQAQVLKIEYKMDGSDTPQVMELKNYKSTPDFENQTMEIAEFTNAIFANRQALVKDTRKDIPSARQNSPANGPPLQKVESVLNVTDNTGKENRCAALSIAGILLHRNNMNLQDAAKISEHVKVPLVRTGTEDDLTVLSNGLITLAATEIQTNRVFRQGSYYDNIVASLTTACESERVIQDGLQASISEALKHAAEENNSTTREQVVAKYAELIQKPWQMLDLPFFNALTELGLPSITLKQAPNAFALGSINAHNLFNVTIDQIEGPALGNICFVVHNKAHYKAALIGRNPSPEQIAALRTIFKNEINKTLGQITALAADPKAADDKYDEMNHLITSVVTQYPADAKPMIIQMLAKDKRVADAATDDNAFIEAAVDAFLKPTAV